MVKKGDKTEFWIGIRVVAPYNKVVCSGNGNVVFF